MPAPTADGDRIQNLGRRLRSMAGALRRRGLWLVFGALGGLLGGAFVATTTKPPVVYKRYYKATAGMRLVTPATTSKPVDPVLWSLQLAQLTVASEPYRLAVATQSGYTVGTVKNHVMTVAYQDTATLELSVVSTNAIRAEEIAFHAANELNSQIAEDVLRRRDSHSTDIDRSIASVDSLIDALQEELSEAPPSEQAAIQKNLNNAQAQARVLRDERQGMTITPPVFVLSSKPEAIEINAKAYYARWLLSSNDIGAPRIKANASLTDVDTGKGSGNDEAAKAVLAETELPEPKIPPPIQPISLGLLAGLVMGLSGVLLGEAWDNRIHDSIHAARASGMDVIVEIPRMSGRKVRRLLASPSPKDGDKVADARLRYREAAWVIASKLGVDPREAIATDDVDTQARQAPIILVTSTTPAEGKTTSTAALAAALGYLGFDVLAVDGDYHHRSLRGLVRPIPNFVAPEDPSPTLMDRVWHMDDPESVDRSVTSSAIVARLVKRTIAQRENFDVILIDTPPVLATTDAIEYLQYADAAVMIVRLEQTDAHACEHTANKLIQHGMMMPGIIVTDVPASTIDQFQDPRG